MKAVRKNMEWDLNDWKWDGDQFTAAPLKSVAADCRSRQFFPIGSEIPAVTGLSNSSSSCSEEIDLRNEREQRELEKRRRVVVVEDELDDESGSLNLNLGGMVYPRANGEVENWIGKSGKKTKLVGSISNGAVCQVDDCRADLSSAKDYHRRHKVCAVHSKATKAVVGSAMQRFCQQCSRFHLLQEFDEGKRSCRRRLAGHNKRRRKTHPENSNSGVPVNDELSSSYLLISLLRILSNMHTNSSDQMKDQDLLSHLLKNLASVAGTINEGNLSGLLNGSSKLQDFVASRGQDPSRPTRQCMVTPSSGMTQKREFVDIVSGKKFQTPPAQFSNIQFPTKDCTAVNTNASNARMERIKEFNIDLNNVYDDSEECVEPLERSDAPIYVKNGSAGYPILIHQDSDKSSPPQTSGNSGSLSTQSPSSSSEEAQLVQVRTDRIVFKLFGKDPSEFPLVLRSQILGWLAHSPTDIESYIRPGCVILTVYLRMEKSRWEVLCGDLSFSLRKLLDSDSFWKEGWIYTRVQNRVAFVHDGEVVLDTQLTVTNEKNCNISSIRPIAVSVSENANFSVKGFNMSQSTRILCALEGMYLVQQSCSELMDGCGSLSECEKGQSLSFPCSIPNVMGRGFIEVEDQTLGTSFFPFIVAEKDVCSEICTLESALELAETTHGIKGETEHSEVHNQALEFVHEMGWLLHRSQLKIRLGPKDPNLDLFSFKRFRCLMEFSLDHDWCAVVKKLLCILFSGIVDSGEHPNVERALLDIGVLHRAVQRNCRPMVQALLSFIPASVIDKYGLEQTLQGHIFRPDSAGPGGLTPLHIAASRDGYETVLDALTDDPQSVGIEAWKNARDGAGLTPHDYACQRGYYSYINIIQKKIKTKSGRGHVVVDIPGTINQKLVGGLKSTEVSSFQTEKTIMKLVQANCNLCEQKLAYGNYRRSLASYRPAMLAMVAIAAVCVCVALLFKSSPEVLYVFQPFRWEHLKFGSS